MQIEENYSVVANIGSGAYGEILLCRCEKDYFVVKKFRKLDSKFGMDIDTMRELKFLTSLKHPHVVDIHRVFLKNHQICMQMDFMLPLHELIFDLTADQFGIKHVRYILRQILEGLHYLHLNEVIHRDLKPGNILVTYDSQVKITDFGLSRRRDQRMTKQVCTIHYRAPEVFFGSSVYGPEIDIWSAGCTFAEMLLKKFLFNGDNAQEIMGSMVNLLGNPENWDGYQNLSHAIVFEKRTPVKLERVIPNLDEEGADLLKHMLCYNPKHRWTAKQCLEHPFFLKEKQPLQLKQKVTQRIKELCSQR